MAIIISLTSFGNRLEESAYRAICTLLDQTVEARVVLYLDKHSPTPKLRNLTSLEIVEGCKDIGSYSKLVWALQQFPNDTLITADDDVYYPRNWLQMLLEQHEKYPDKIIAHRAHGVTFKNDGLAPFLEWHERVKDAPVLFPMGVGGVLYPPDSLHEDATNSELFLKLSPRQDDIWFWAMAVLNDKQHHVVPNGYRWSNRIDENNKAGGTCLWEYNIFGGGDDVQLKAVVEYYPKLQEWVKFTARNICSANHTVACPSGLDNGAESTTKRDY